MRNCQKCQESPPTPAAAPLHPREWPTNPWARVHLDYAGPFQGRMFLVLVDAHSKWMEVAPVTTSSSTMTIEKLRTFFATHGIPQKIVTDNGPQFTSKEFADFTRSNGIEHTCTAPYHPASNGLAERAVRTFKQGLRRITEGSLETRLARFLFQYRITPHSTTGRSPAELLIGRQPRSRFDLLHPDGAAKVANAQTKQKQRHDMHSRVRGLQVGDKVYIRNFTGLPAWLPGTLLEQTGPVSFRVQLSSGRIHRRHVDHIRIRHTPDAIEANASSFVGTGVPAWPGGARGTGDRLTGEAEKAQDGGCGSSTETGSPQTEFVPRRSSRIRKPPDRLC